MLPTHKADSRLHFFLLSLFPNIFASAPGASENRFITIYLHFTVQHCCLSLLILPSEFYFSSRCLLTLSHLLLNTAGRIFLQVNAKAVKQIQGEMYDFKSAQNIDTAWVISSYISLPVPSSLPWRNHWSHSLSQHTGRYLIIIMHFSLTSIMFLFSLWPKAYYVRRNSKIQKVQSHSQGLRIKFSLQILQYWSLLVPLGPTSANRWSRRIPKVLSWFVVIRTDQNK